MEQRKKNILEKVVENYIETAEPVASKTLLASAKFDISPATMRHELNELEQEGYLTHLHTSSGRVPTDKGYRLFVDSLMSIKDLSPEQQKLISSKVKVASQNVNEVIQQLVDIVSGLINYTTIVITPDIYTETLKVVHLVSVDINRVLVVLLNSLGINREFLVDLQGKVDQEDLNKLSQLITKKIEGKYFTSINKEFFAELIAELPDQKHLLTDLYKNIQKMNKELNKDKNLLIKGTPKMLRLPEFKNIDFTRKVLEILEENKVLSGLLQARLKNKNTLVLIGEESEVENLQECSLVMAPFCFDDEAVGMVSVLGPTRMSYPVIVPLVQNVTDMIGRFLKEKKLTKGGVN